MDVRGISFVIHALIILYVISLTKTDLHTTDELVVSQSNDHHYKGSRLAFTHCLPARRKPNFPYCDRSVLVPDTLGMLLTDTLGF